MNLDYVKTLYSEALPDGRLPSIPELHAVMDDPEHANALHAEYLRQRTAYEMFLRSVRGGNPYIANVLETLETDEAKRSNAAEAMRKVRALMEFVASVPDKATVIRSLHSPGVIVADMARVAFAERYLQLIGEALSGL